MVYVDVFKTWMEGTYDIPNTNPCFFVTTEPIRMGFLLLLKCIFLMLGSHCRAICYERHDWPFVADRNFFFTVQNFTTISTIATIVRGPHIVTDDRGGLQHIPTEPGVGLVKG